MTATPSAVTEDEQTDRRDRWIPKIRASEEELSGIEARRSAAGLSLSAFMRRMALDGAIVQREPLADRELIQHLAAIGNNLNQIARKANIRGELDSELHMRVEGLLFTLEEAIDELIS